MAGSFIVHGTLLHADYAKLPNLFRPPSEAQQYFPYVIKQIAFDGMLLLLLGAAVAFLYRRPVGP
jgi:hypothetical protein